MNTEKISCLLDAINNAPLVQVDASQFDVNISFSNPIGQPDNEIICFTWEDEDGLGFIAKITEDGLDKAICSEDGVIQCHDSEGELTIIQLCEAVAIKTRPWD